MATDVILTCPNVNSGNPVSFKGATITYGWKNLTRVTPLTNQFSLSEAQITGFENPKITVTGFIDTNDTTANVVTQPLLIAFSKIPYDGTVPNTISFSVSTGNKSVYLRNTDDDANSIKVMVESFNLNIDAGDSDLGYLWRYTLQLVETK